MITIILYEFSGSRTPKMIVFRNVARMSCGFVERMLPEKRQIVQMCTNSGERPLKLTKSPLIVQAESSETQIMSSQCAGRS